MRDGPVVECATLGFSMPITIDPSARSMSVRGRIRTWLRRHWWPVAMPAPAWVAGLCVLVLGVLLVEYSRRLEHSSASTWAQGVAMNLGFLLIGTTFTVMVVDVIVRRNDQLRWQGVADVFDER